MNSRVGGELRKAVDREAARRGVSRSDFVRSALRAAVGQGDVSDVDPAGSARRASGQPQRGPGRGGIRAPRSPSEADAWAKGDERQPRAGEEQREE